MQPAFRKVVIFGVGLIGGSFALALRRANAVQEVVGFGRSAETLRQAADAFRTKHGDQYDVVITLDPAHVETPDLDKAYAVAEFMLNLLEIKSAPTRQDVEAYVQANFATPDGGYRIPVHQDFLTIRHRPTVGQA